MGAVSREPAFEREEPRTIELAQELEAIIGQVAHELRTLLKQPHLADHMDPLDALAKKVIALEGCAQKALAANDESTELKEALKDAGEIIQNILSQPLLIPGAKRNISLFEAAKTYEIKEALRSDFRKILLSFLQFPVPTERMIEELELLQDDLQC